MHLLSAGRNFDVDYFLGSFTFGMVLMAFVYYGNQEPEVFHQSRLQLNTSFGLINTVFLLTSGGLIFNFNNKKVIYFHLYPIDFTDGGNALVSTSSVISKIAIFLIM